MDRRTILRGLMVGVPTAAGFAAGAAIRSKAYVQDASEVTLGTIKTQLEELKAQFDRTDAKNRKLIKTAIVLAALSLGVDVTAIL